jgi:hypothetical protein
MSNYLRKNFISNENLKTFKINSLNEICPRCNSKTIVSYKTINFKDKSSCIYKSCYLQCGYSKTKNY